MIFNGNVNCLFIYSLELQARSSSDYLFELTLTQYIHTQSMHTKLEKWSFEKVNKYILHTERFTIAEQSQ